MAGKLEDEGVEGVEGVRGECWVGDKGVSGVRLVGEGSEWDIVGLVGALVTVRARVWVCDMGMCVRSICIRQGTVRGSLSEGSCGYMLVVLGEFVGSSQSTWFWLV